MFNFVVLFFLQQVQAEFKFSFDSIITAQYNDVIDSDLNTFNQILLLPDDDINLDLRSELKWRFNSSQLILRPRIVSRIQKKTDFQTKKVNTDSKNELNITDAFIETHWNSIYSTTFGLQVYSWGPTEFLNSSNPFFHFNTKQKSLYYKEKGQILIRNNFSIDKENNFVFAIMPISNNESPWIENDEFVTKAFLKYERSWEGSFNSIGLVVGREEKKNLFFGEYFNYSFLESASFYGDIKQAQYKVNFEPVQSGNQFNLEYLNRTQDQWNTLADIGLRWESDYDLRIEYIFNSAGFDQGNMKNAIQSATNKISIQYLNNLKRFLKPGLELIGRNYFYISIRITDPFQFKDLNLYGRGLFSGQDQSNQVQLEVDKSFFDSFNAFSNLTMSFGGDNSEFRLLNAWSFLIGLKYSL